MRVRIALWATGRPQSSASQATLAPPDSPAIQLSNQPLVSLWLDHNQGADQLCAPLPCRTAASLSDAKLSTAVYFQSI